MPYSLFTRSAFRSRKLMALLVAFALVFDLASGAIWNAPVALAHESDEQHEEVSQGDEESQQEGDGGGGSPSEEESPESCESSGSDGEGCEEQEAVSENEGDERGAPEEKVTICHLPPGNPENAQGITISVNAAQLPGHLQHGDSVGSCEVPPPTTDTGTIRICKVIASEEGVLATSSEGIPDGMFAIGLSYGFTPSSAMSYATATWNSVSFMPDTDLIGHDGVNDAVCVSYGALPIGSYYYDEEWISGDGEWLAPKYNDQYTHPFDDLSDLFAYSPALFTADPSDDNTREQNADGHIVLSKDQTRTLVVLNTYEDEDVPPPPPPAPVCGDGVVDQLIGESCDDGNLISGDGCSNQCRVEPVLPPVSCSLTLVSDTSNIVVGGGNAVATYDDNPAWTAMIPGATWIWKTFFVENPTTDEITIFEKVFAIERPVATATLAIAADNSYEITLNGTPFAADPGQYNYRESGKDIYDLATDLASGTNTLRISVKNWGLSGSSARSNPAGLLYRLEVAYGGQGCVDTPPPVCSDGLDNDNDGNADFPLDPGCDTPTDNDENEKPVITVLGDNPMDILLGATFTDPGATASDPEDGDITPNIVATGTVDTLTLGTYTIRYNVADSDGLAADEKTRTVRVVQAPVCSDGVDNDGDGRADYPADPGCDTPTDNDENEKPVITVLGDNPMTLTLGSTFTDPSATVADPEDGDITAKLVTTGSVDTGIVGSYTITYNATDSDNMAADPKTRTVIVATVCSDGLDNDGDGKADFPLDEGCGDPTDDSENTPPTVTLLGATPISVIVGTLFTDPGATAFDLEDGTLTPSVSGSVNTAVIGVYMLTYGATDSKGATATPVTRTVNVIPEPTFPPVCSDGLDNDNDGNADFPLDPGCDTPTDNDENEKPVITVLGDNPMDILLGATFTDPGATASDPEDGDITPNIVATGTVDTLTLGTYTIRYNVADSDGLAADEKTRTVRVVSACSDGRDNDGDGFVDFPADAGCGDPTDDSENEKPVITLLGDVLMTIFAGQTFTDPSATVADPEDGDITAKLVTTGSVDTGIVGSYTITYNATDSDNMAADPKTRTVQVLTAPCTVNCGGGGTPPVCSDGSDNDGDGLADYPRDPGCSSSDDPDERDGDPVITVLGDNPMTVTRGGTFTDPGATASDPDDGDITSRIVATGTVDMTTSGTYAIRYNVTDTAGHPAPEKTRTVNVVDPSNPGCTANCGGGGGGPTPLTIMNERLSVTSSSTAIVTWNTNLPATSRVVYGGASVPAAGSAPMYGYPVTTATSTTLTTSHSVAIDMHQGLPYFFRPASSDGRSEVRGIELAHVPGAPLPEPCFYLRDYLRLGANNDPSEVRKLQAFLRDLEGHSALEVTGFFDTTTDLAVRAFQEKYRVDVLDPWALPAPTGYVYYTTQKKVNEIFCARAFPLNGLQESEIAEFRTLMQTILANPGSTSGVTVPLVGANVGAGGAGSNSGTPFSPEVAERLAAGIPVVGEEGSVAGTSSVAEATEDGETPRKSGRISIESLLAVTPSATTALSGQEQASGTASTTPKTKGALAAVAGSFAEKMNIPVWSLYLSSLILFVAIAIAVWILLRSREDDGTPVVEAVAEKKR